jgi:Type II CAAX prenyl endopeptidase Rce1-like
MKKHLVFLWFLAILGGLAVLPYAYQAGVLSKEIPVSKLVLISVIKSGIVYAVILWLCSLLIPKTDLKPFRTGDPVKRIILPALIAGVAVGFTLFALSKTVFQNSIYAKAAFPSSWRGILASLYGGINEEILLRLFLFTLIYFLLSKLCKSKGVVFWAANIFVALLFGIGHLPAAQAIAPLNAYEVSRILVLNGIAGLAFGWLYVMNGFYTAVLAHLITDIVVHGILFPIS